jgi:hypothetical protein
MRIGRKQPATDVSDGMALTATFTALGTVPLPQTFLDLLLLLIPAVGARP